MQQYFVSADLKRASAVKAGQPAPPGPGYQVEADDRDQALRRVRHYRLGCAYASDVVKVVH
ncbi:hypothetical protein [Nitrospirillum amazonense]|uniref:hypothetical protein n=1 Tax=Nitrospirillum amazonense TaxID=28077 RepID=UPI0024128BAE|nr:hypothetical protein [Nitrospirillum amazonense]MDG3444663.1 hypothetical protein [Nitrospirillum amazonense]